MSDQPSFLQKLTTGLDNYTPDVGRWSWLLCTASVLTHDAWQLAHQVHVDVKDLALALSAIAASHGIALGAKAKTEPKGEA